MNTLYKRRSIRKVKQHVHESAILRVQTLEGNLALAKRQIQHERTRNEIATKRMYTVDVTTFSKGRSHELHSKVNKNA